MANETLRRPDFDLKALYYALDEQRRARSMSWAAVAREVNQSDLPGGHPIAASTITGLKDKPVGEGDGILQMLLWLQRTPESFIPGFPDADGEQFRLREVKRDQILRWDARAVYLALNLKREARRVTWRQLAGEIAGHTPGMLTNLAKGGRVGFPGIMRIVQWLGQPATTFTRVSGSTAPAR